MRNGDNNRDTESLTPGAGVYSPGARRARRRKQVVGAVGILALLGVGGVVAQQTLGGDDTGPASPAGAQQPLAPVGGSTSAGASKAPGKAAPKKSAGAPAAPSEAPKTDAERITAARSAAAKAKATPLVRAPLPKTGTVASVEDLDVTEATTQQEGGTLKVVSAEADLTGYGELSWVADKGTKAGDARCTKKIRLSTAVPATERPTLLLCWRTSAAKSVYTLAVVAKGRPTTSISTDALAKEWKRLG
jgi:hypothetical protein